MVFEEKGNISEAQEGISLALRNNQEYFRAGSGSLETEGKGESQELGIGLADKFHPCKKITEDNVAQVLFKE